MAYPSRLLRNTGVVTLCEGPSVVGMISRMVSSAYRWFR